MGGEYVLRDAFTRAKAYQKSWQDYEKKKATDPNAVAPKRDLQLEPLGHRHVVGVHARDQRRPRLDPRPLRGGEIARSRLAGSGQHRAGGARDPGPRARTERDSRHSP